MNQQAERVIIGVDPHKQLLGSGRFTTDRAGYAAMRTYAKKWPDRVWAVEVSNGAGRPLAQRLLEDGERVVDVPAKLAARVRLFDTGHNRKTDAHDAHAVAAVAVRTKTLRVLQLDGRLKNPARSTCPRTSTLRISHFPDPRRRRYAEPVDTRREPVRRTCASARIAACADAHLAGGQVGLSAARRRAGSRSPWLRRSRGCPVRQGWMPSAPGVEIHRLILLQRLTPASLRLG
jgi:hypothetical protein